MAVVVMLIANIALPVRLTVVPAWVLPALSAVLVIPVLISAPRRHPGVARWTRSMSLVVLAVLAAAHLIGVALLASQILAGRVESGQDLIRAAIILLLTNVVVFGLTYWEVDGGGPEARAARRAPGGFGDLATLDFLFPQMSGPHLARPGWFPTFPDYLYVGLTNAIAFSPTDAMPLTVRAKALMGFQSLVAVVTVVLVASRAVNILI
jgi:hypothetical protein